MSPIVSLIGLLRGLGEILDMRALHGMGPQGVRTLMFPSLMCSLKTAGRPHAQVWGLEGWTWGVGKAWSPSHAGMVLSTSKLLTIAGAFSWGYRRRQST